MGTAPPPIGPASMAAALPLLPAAPATAVAGAGTVVAIEPPAAPGATASAPAGAGPLPLREPQARPLASRPALPSPAADARAPAGARTARPPQAEPPLRGPVVPRPVGPPPADDPDVDLVAALMAHVPPGATAARGAGRPAEALPAARAPGAGHLTAAAQRGADAGAGRAATIDQRVQRCKAQATLAQSRACRRRVCEAHWGAHPACPVRLKAPAPPKLVARGASAPGRAATPS